MKPVAKVVLTISGILASEKPSVEGIALGKRAWSQLQALRFAFED